MIRMYNHGHNSLIGQITLSQKVTINILNRPSVTNEAKKLATQAYGVLSALREELNNRVEPDGKIKRLGKRDEK